MAIRQLAIAAALIPTIAFGAYVPGTNTTWNASRAAEVLLETSKENVALAIYVAAATTGNTTAAAGLTNAAKLAELAVTSLTCVASGPSASGVLVLNMLSSTNALEDSQFPRWIAKAFAFIMGAHESQVDVAVKAGVRRLTTDGAGRRLTDTVTANYNVYNPNRGRNIGLGVGLGLLAPAAGLGLGLGLGMKGGDAGTTPVPVETSVPPVAVTVAPTEAPSSGSSMPLWAGILLGLAVLACIGAAVFFGTQKKEKKKRPIKKAAPVVEEVKIVEEVTPMLAPVQTYQPAPMVQTYQPAPAFQSVQYVQQAPPVTYAAAAPVYTSISRAF